MKEVECVGWWQQYGKREPQTMRLVFDGSRFGGRGQDILGSFSISDGVCDNGDVSFIKTYDGAHDVLYEGHYETGEGQTWRGKYGFWHGIGGDLFEISLKSSSGDIKEIAPQ